GPGKALASDTDAIADRAATAEHVIEIGVAGIDDDRAGRFTCVEIHDLAAQPLRQQAVLVLRRGAIVGVALTDMALREGARVRRRVAERLRMRGGDDRGGEK